MSSEVDICNLALGNIKAGRIDTLDDDSAEGRACKLRYPQSRDAVLQGHWWNLAGKTATLAQLTTTPDEWEYEY